jgi:Family of unknown function (DUF6804)
MLTTIVKCVSVGTLLALLAFLWRAPSDYRSFLAAFVVFAGALVVLIQAVHARKYFWAAAFFSLGVVFNPLLPVMLSRNIFLLLGLSSLVLFTVSLASLKPAHRLSIASITDRRALRSESL